MNKNKYVLAIILLVAAPSIGFSQKSFFKKFIPTAHAKKVKVMDSTKQEKLADSSIHFSFKDNLVKFHNGVKKTLDKTFSDFTGNNVYLLAGMNVSKQNITTGNYASNFNYDLADYNKNAFKPGYYAGVRVDGKYKQKHNYSLAVSLNKIATGTSYKDAGSLSPFLGSFSKFKADDQFFTLSIAAHYKKLIPLGDTAKRKFYFVVGPSLDTRLSGQSADNLVNNNYHRLLLRGDVGLEFDNQSYYTLFIHYKQGLTSFTKAPIVTNLNSVEIGMMIKASDLF